MPLPPLGPLVPRRGNALTHAWGRAVFAAIGWRIEGIVPDMPHAVVIVAPHTAAWDLIVGLAAKTALGIDLRWLGKHTIFRPPLGMLLRWLGGTPVNRASPLGVVDQAIALFKQNERLFLGLSPEGTRRRVDAWKTGFHRIATGAGVPIVTVALDYRTRTVRIGSAYEPTGDADTDVAALRGRFTAAMGRYPELYAQ